MTRANRQFAHHPVWHITQRCHRKQFLLKFKRDRANWRYWLFQARRRYGLSVLNYIVTRNHVHLLIYSEDSTTVARSMQLVAGRTAQHYNRRKDRRGAFWEDRYHAVPVRTDRHLLQCLVYIDLNMVRAGVVAHPADWIWSGYVEIQRPRKRYVVIDQERLLDILGLDRAQTLRRLQRDMVAEKIACDELTRDPRWTTGIEDHVSLDRDFLVENQT